MLLRLRFALPVIMLMATLVVIVAVIVASFQKAMSQLFHQEESNYADDYDEIVQRLFRIV